VASSSGFLYCWITKLVAALLQLPVLGQDAMHGADRTEINAFIDQHGKDLRRGLVAEALQVQMIEHGLPFSGIQRTRRRRADSTWSGWLHAPIQRCPWHTEGAASNRFPHAVTQLQGGAHQFSSSIWIFGIGLPNNAATFFELQ
jgi:hypothetical protein